MRYLSSRETLKQSLNLARRASTGKGEGGSRETRRNLKLFDAVARLKTSRPLSFQRHRSAPPTRFVQPNVFDARDDRNRGVWQGTAGDDCREKVCFTTDLLSRHARILSKLDDSEGEGRRCRRQRRRPIAFYTRLPLADLLLLSLLYRYAILRKEK